MRSDVLDGQDVLDAVDGVDMGIPSFGQKNNAWRDDSAEDRRVWEPYPALC